MAENRPILPADSLRAAVPQDHEAHATIDALQGELAADNPAAETIKEHVETLSGHPSLADIVAGWFEDPKTQAFIDELTATGL